MHSSCGMLHLIFNLKQRYPISSYNGTLFDAKQCCLLWLLVYFGFFEHQTLSSSLAIADQTSASMLSAIVEEKHPLYCHFRAPSAASVLFQMALYLFSCDVKYRVGPAELGLLC